MTRLENVTIDIEGEAPWSGKRSIGHYGGALDKRNNESEPQPAAWSMYREIQKAKGSAFSTKRSGILHAETLATARVLAAGKRSNEKLFLSSMPGSSAERLGYWMKLLKVTRAPGETLQDVRQHCAVRYRSYKSLSSQTIDRVLTDLLGERFYSVVRTTGATLASEPTHTYWPGGDTAPSDDYNLHSTTGETFLSPRAHINVLLRSLPGRSGVTGPLDVDQDTVFVASTRLFPVLDDLLGSECTFSYTVLSPAAVAALEAGVAEPFTVVRGGEPEEFTFRHNEFLEGALDQYGSSERRIYIPRTDFVQASGSDCDTLLRRNAPSAATTIVLGTPSNRPAYLSDGSPALGGKVAVDFDRSNSEYLIGVVEGQWAGLSDGTGGTIVVAVNDADASGGTDTIFSTYDGSVSETGVRLYRNATTLSLTVANSGGVTNIHFGSATVDYGPHVYAMVTDSNGVSFYIDGVFSAGMSGAFSGVPDSGDPKEPLTVGANDGGGGQFGDFTLGAIYYDDTALSEGDIIQISRAMGAEFGIEIG